MLRKKYTNITLDCLMQHAEITEHECPSGVISKTASGGFLFEESVRKCLPPRNPKLYDGRYISMTRHHDGLYHFNFKRIDSRTLDRKNYAKRVSAEIASAIQLMNVEH